MAIKVKKAAAQNKGVFDDLIFYSIDKASPYALALHQSTNSLDKILKYKLTQLAMTDQGVALMWLYINAGLGQQSAKPVSPAVGLKSKTAEDVRNAVYDANAGAKK